MSKELTAAEPGRHRRVVLEAGVRIGTYTLTGAEVGSGGYAHVYEATHPTLELRVAIKVQDGYGDATIRERGLREAMVLSRVQHRNVVQIFDAGELADGRQYLAMELLTGQTLREVMNDRPLSHAQCLAFLRGIASALDAIHARGLVHRDLKPSNIFVCRDDDGEVYPKLIDFGIAKDLSLGNDRELTTSGSFIGTPAYMSPEQCLGKRTLDARSDIYALGVVAYQMLAGHPPFDGVLLEVAHAHAHTPAPSIRSASLPASLDPVFAQILAKDPEARPGSASDAIELLAEALAAPDAPVSRPRRRILAVAVAAIAIGAAVWIGRADDEPPRPPPSPAIAPIASIDAAIAPLVVDAAPEVIVAPDAVPAIQKPKTQPKRPSIDDVESLPSN